MATHLCTCTCSNGLTPGCAWPHLIEGGRCERIYRSNIGDAPLLPGHVSRGHTGVAIATLIDRETDGRQE
jgi:hypothetical protein